MGATVIGIANSPLRIEAARQVGAHAALLSEDSNLKEKLEDTFGEIGPDIVVLTANQWEAYRLSVAMARYGGRVSVLGFPGRLQPKPDFNPLDPEWFYGKQLTLLGAGFAPRADCPPQDLRFNIRRNLQYILELMAARSLRLESLITHCLPASRMKEAYELAKEHDKSLIAAIFDWRADQ
jgi:threonine dehydrogenase-like Zn-dependent dehydrogenase